MNDSIVATLMADSWVHPAMAPNDNYPGFVDVESLANYTLGGYCPINIDDRFRNGSDIYTIIHKLGFGRASTVWLAKREKLNTGNISFHALKILRADFSTQDTYAEYTTLWYLEQLNRESHPGLVHVQDRFHISSANGKHHCFVLPFLGPSLCDRRVLDAMSRETRQSVCEQLAHAVNYIHASDVCHADLNPFNVRFKIPGLENIDEASLRGMLTPVMSHTITQADGTTLCVIKTARFQNLDFHSLRKVTIIGFGRAFAESLPRSTLQQRPTAMVFPELLFGLLPSKKSDVWQLACLLFLVQAQVLPFRITKGYDYLLWELTRYLGPIPDSWEGKYQWSKYKIILPLGRICDWDLNVWFDEEQPTRTLETRILGVERGKAREMAALLHKMLAWEPEKRPRSGEVYQEVLQWGLSG